MTAFRRVFSLDCLTDEVLEENAWFIDLLRKWHPAGNEGKSRLTDTNDVLAQACVKTKAEMRHLRAAFRGGYMNFYCGGQSIAKVGFCRKQLRARIHEKYVYGCERTSKKYARGTSAGFQEPGQDRVAPYGDQHLERWISNANTKIGTEKRFVDLVVSHNPDVIDLEMGLPAYSKVPKERVAPRIDMVALEPCDGGWQLVLWEAKLVGDGRARCSGSELPEVVDQLKHYSDWLSDDERAKSVLNAYQNTCRLFVDLHAIARRFRPDIEKLGPGIRAVANSDASALLIDRKPRLLIVYDHADTSLEENGHADKLRGAGVPVKIVKTLNDIFLCGIG